VMSEDVDRYMSSGFTHCVGKPVDFDHLSGLLAKLLDAEGFKARTGATDLPEFEAIKRNFENELPGSLDRLEKFINDGRLNDVSQLAHSLKGSAGSFGYPGVTEVSRRLEEAARKGDASRVREIFQELVSHEEVRPFQALRCEIADAGL